MGYIIIGAALVWLSSFGLFLMAVDSYRAKHGIVIQPRRYHRR